VVKPLGAVLEGHPLFAGVSFRGTGDLALVLDVPGVFDGTGGRGADAGPAPAPDRGARAAFVEPPTAGGAPDSTDTRPAPAPAAAAPPAPVAAAAPRALRVLFVDDSVSVRKVAERTLRDLGAEVTLASDGVDALDKLRTTTFDLVFTDLEMPRMHGYDLLREIRYVPGLAKIPVVVVSSRSGTKHQDQARSLGATDYLTKPFSAESLGAALTRWGRRG
jgi:chemosensory pili system protein ChpA (sensor histidine kinase/response regulator)